MKKILIWVLLAFLGLSSGCKAQDTIPLLTPDEYERAVAADTTAVVIDVRKADEFAEGHVMNARLLDVLDTADFDAGIRHLDKSNTYYVYCRSGRRSHNAALKMHEQGLKVVDMKGGILAWKAAGKPVVSGR